MTLPHERTALYRLFTVSFLADFQLYVVYTAIPFKALALGAGPLELGGLAALSTGTYALLAPLFGRWSDRVPRTALARTSCMGFIFGCIGMTMAPSLLWMFVFMPFIGGSMSPFWPSVQASVADRARFIDLERQLGRFNLGWSTGKACGFLLGGALVQGWGVAAAFTVASCIAFAIYFILPGEPRAAESLPQGGSAREPARVLSLDARAPRFRRMAWLANGIAFGLGATLNHHYPRLIEEFGWSPRFFGLFLGLIYLLQTATFALMMLRPNIWRFRRTYLYGPQLLMLIAVVTLPLAGLERVLVSALVFGVGLGACYYASIYYSLHTGEARGRNAGVHESLIGMGSMLVPLAGGITARLLDALWAPYAVAGLAVGLALGVQEIVYRRPARNPVARVQKVT